jgi:cyclic pyranopterin phosphate synthase
MPSEMNISLTTNGILLADQAQDLADAGLHRINVSLDSLEPQTYRAITGAQEGDLERVLAGIDAAASARLLPIKLNIVVLKENEAEISDLIEFCRERGLIAQLIQLLDLGGRGPSGDIDGVERQIAAQADSVRIREMHRRKKYFLGEAEVEIVRPMDNTEFCASCTRLRVTSDGKVKPCLLRNDNLVDIDSCSPERIMQLLEEANARREPYFKEPSLKGCKSCTEN